MLVFCFLLISAFSLHTTFCSIEYPAHIEELGDVVVTRPILDSCPEGALIIPHNSEQRPVQFLPARVYSQSALNIVPLEAISKYFLEMGIMDLISRRVELTYLDRHFVSLLRNQLNAFNPSFLDEYTYYDEKVVVIGAVFLRLFKAAYPGLYRVKLSKLEIVNLCLIASSWFMSLEEESEKNLDTFFATCLRFYCPRYFQIYPLNNLNFSNFYRSGFKITFEAAFQLLVKRIINRSILSLDGLNPSTDIIQFIGDRKMFLKFLPFVADINDVELLDSNSCHILLYMIRIRVFYPEAFLRPELKDFKVNFDNRICFDDFYSEALYYAVSYSNAPAVNFLLNLDYSYYHMPNEVGESANDVNEIENEVSENEVNESESENEVNESEIENEVNESDSDSNSSFSTVDISSSPPLSLEAYNSLRAIFFSETVEDALEIVPNIAGFKFCQFDTAALIAKFKFHFPSLMRLQNFLIEEKQCQANTSSTSSSSSSVVGLKRSRSESPTAHDY